MAQLARLLQMTRVQILGSSAAVGLALGLIALFATGGMGSETVIRTCTRPCDAPHGSVTASVDRITGRWFIAQDQVLFTATGGTTTSFDHSVDAPPAIGLAASWPLGTLATFLILFGLRARNAGSRRRFRLPARSQ